MCIWVTLVPLSFLQRYQWNLSTGLLFVLDVLEFVMVIVALAGLYRYVPNARVRWPHALVGGLLAGRDGWPHEAALLEPVDAVGHRAARDQSLLQQRCNQLNLNLQEV